MTEEQDKSAFRRDLLLRYQSEEAVRAQSVAIIDADARLSMDLCVIECAMNTLQFYRVNHPVESDNIRTVHLLGFRLFNSAASAMRLTLCGYYQAAGTHIRDILETAFLLDYFSTNEALIERWRTIEDESVRAREFNLAKIRETLDKRDGFTGMRRNEHYKLLCRVAAHPTVTGFRMLQPNPGADALMGCFFARDSLKGTLQELARSLLVAWENFQWFFPLQSRAHYQALLNYFELTRDWWDCTFGTLLDRNDILALRAVIHHLDHGGKLSDLREPPHPTVMGQ